MFNRVFVIYAICIAVITFASTLLLGSAYDAGYQDATEFWTDLDQNTPEPSQVDPESPISVFEQDDTFEQEIRLQNLLETLMECREAELDLWALNRFEQEVIQDCNLRLQQVKKTNIQILDRCLSSKGE
jgi:hypothetical protein